MAEYVTPVKQFLKSIDLQPYDRYLPNAFNDSLTMLEKVNKVVHHMNESNQLTNDMVQKWNDFVEWVNKDGINEPVDTKINELLTDGTFANLLNVQVMNDFKEEIQTKTNQLIDNVSTQLEKNTKKLKNAQVDLVVDFGGSVTNENNHSQIISALDYLNNNGGGTLLVPIGEFKTSPLVLKGYRNIIIKGVSPSLPWKTTSCFKFIQPGEVGIQLSEIAGIGYTNEVPSWSSTEIVIENLRVDANKTVNTGINGNYGITLKNVSVDNALKDGIVLEPMTYPFFMEKVFVRFSGRHGLYVKAPYTTVYNLIDCEFQQNDGYGMYIEDGSTCFFLNVLLQRNKQGGMKIELKNPALYEHPIFLSNMLFINLYTEDSGLLLDTDPKFEGNCAVKTLSYDKTEGRNTGKIPGLTFINSTVNAARPNGNTTKKFELSGITNITKINTEIPESSYIFSENGTLGMRTDLSTVLTDLNKTTPLVESIPFFDKTKNIKAMVGNGYIGKRGRMRELHFSLPQSSIVAGQTVMMNTVHPYKFYPILQSGSLYGINVLKPLAPTVGTLTFKIKTGFKTNASGDLNSTIITNEVIEITPTKNNMSVNFPLLSYMVDGTVIIGIELTVSSDYVSGHTTYSDVICELFIES